VSVLCLELATMRRNVAKIKEPKTVPIPAPAPIDVTEHYQKKHRSGMSLTEPVLKIKKIIEPSTAQNPWTELNWTWTDSLVLGSCISLELNFSITIANINSVVGRIVRCKELGTGTAGSNIWLLDLNIYIGNITFNKKLLSKAWWVQKILWSFWCRQHRC